MRGNRPRPLKEILAQSAQGMYFHVDFLRSLNLTIRCTRGPWYLESPLALLREMISKTGPSLELKNGTLSFKSSIECSNLPHAPVPPSQSWRATCDNQSVLMPAANQHWNGGLKGWDVWQAREATIRPYRFLIPGMDSDFDSFSSALRVWFAPGSTDRLCVT